MAGKKMGSPAGGAALKLFPALARKNNLDPANVEVLNMAPNLQEQMLLRGEVDISAVFTATSYMNLVSLKLDPDKDFRWIYYADAGLDLYSNGVMVSARLAKEKPEAVKGLVRAIARAMRDVVADPESAIALLAAQEPLLNKDIEKRRLTYVTKTLIATPEAAELGVGDIRDARMSEAIGAIVASYELPRTPAVKDVFDRSFLPPKGERVLPNVTN
jgi:NitT/TauT family transport system substrate-binding protein